MIGGAIFGKSALCKQNKNTLDERVEKPSEILKVEKSSDICKCYHELDKGRQKKRLRKMRAKMRKGGIAIKKLHQDLKKLG